MARAVCAECVLGLEEFILDVVAEGGGGGGGGTCNLTTGDKGDITVNTFTNWTIDNGVVTYPKIQNVTATDKILGRASAGAGIVEEIACTAIGRGILMQNTKAAVRTYLELGTASLQNTSYFATAVHNHDAGDITTGIINVTRLGTGPTTNTTFLNGDNEWVEINTGILADGDKGDITVSASGATWTIDNSAVTYAKIQNVSATDKLLGRSSSGAGVVEEIACTSFARSILDDANAVTVHGTLDLNTYYSQVGHTHTAAHTVSGVFNTARLGTGTANSTTWLRGDGTWATISVSPAGSDTQVQFNDNGAFGASSAFTFDDYSATTLSYGKRLTLGTALTHGSLKITGPSQSGSVSSNTWSPAQIQIDVAWDTGLTAPATPITMIVTDTSSAAVSQYISCTSSKGDFLVRKNGYTTASAGHTVQATAGIGYQWGTGTGLFYEAANHVGLRNGASAQKFCVYNNSASNTALNAITGAIIGSGAGNSYERAVIDWQGESNVLRIGTEKGSTGIARAMKLITDGTERVRIAETGAIRFNSAYSFPTTQGLAGQVLVTDGVTGGNGALTFQSVVTGTTTTSSSTSITLGTSNNGGVLVCTSNSNVTVTVPTGLPSDFTMRIIQNGTGDVTIAGASGVTLQSLNNHVTTSGQYGIAWITCTGTNTFNLSGNLKP